VPYDKELGKREVEDGVLIQVLDAFSIAAGWNLTGDWEGEAEQVEGSPDAIVGRDGKPFGVELTEIRDAEDAESYIAEAYRLAEQKSASYSRRGLFKFPIALAMYSYSPPLFDLRKRLAQTVYRPDFDALGFVEIRAVDFSDAYYSARDPRRPADMFCFKPATQFGFMRVGMGDRKPFG
jgi:hypothetical protein